MDSQFATREPLRSRVALDRRDVSSADRRLLTHDHEQPAKNEHRRIGGQNVAVTDVQMTGYCEYPVHRE